MKLIAILLSSLLLTGCLTTPVKRNFPEIPDELKVACPDLKEVDTNTTKLSEVISVVTVNYSEYHSCKVKVDAWIEWYKTQKEIFDSVK